MSIGIFQEIHARNLVQKLSIVVKKMFMLFEMAYNKKLIQRTSYGRYCYYLCREQVPSDMEVIDGKVEANEALLTGESDLIEKEIGDTLLSGSFIVSGQAYARVIHVGAENYAVKITQEAKVHKPIQSELVNSIRKVSKFTSWVIIPLGIILFVEAFG